MLNKMEFVKQIMFFSFILRLTGANIEIFSDHNEPECGGNLTLTCIIKKESSVVSWLNENDIEPIASCWGKICLLNPKYAEKYHFTFDINQGVLNLTMINVTRIEDGRILDCSDGTESASTKVTVKDYKAELHELTKDGMIRATSGCVSKDRDVVFNWTKIDVTTKHESLFLPKQPTVSTKHCDNVFLCGKNEQIQQSQAISASAHNNGQYYVKISIVYGNETTKSQTTSLRYMLEEQGNNDKDESDFRMPYVHENIVALNIVVGILLLVFIIIIALKKIKKSFRRRIQER